MSLNQTVTKCVIQPFPTPASPREKNNIHINIYIIVFMFILWLNPDLE